MSIRPKESRLPRAADALDELLDSYESIRPKESRLPRATPRDELDKLLDSLPEAKAPKPIAQARVSPRKGREELDKLIDEVVLRIPVTGTRILEPNDDAREGAGDLNVHNGTEFDAVIKLVTASTPRKTLWMAYVRGGDRTEISRIAPDDYLLRFALGEAWDETTRKFRRRRVFYQLDKALQFTETAEKYTELSVTLHAVPGGNLPRKTITEEVFNEGDGSAAGSTTRF